MKVYSPAVQEAVAECLRTAYWFQEDLKSFLKRAGVPIEVVDRLPWGKSTYKRTIIKELIDLLAANPTTGTSILSQLIDSLVELDEAFPHLRRLDDGKRKASDAAQSLRALKDLLGKETIADRAERARREARTEAQRTQQSNQARQDDLKNLNKRFLQLCAVGTAPKDTRRRGIDFQNLLRDLFAMHDLDPRGSFAQVGEQIDGSISLDGTFILIEMKWEKVPIEPKDVRDFKGKVQGKLDNTLGLIVSMSGYTDAAIEEAARGGRIVAVLMDGRDVAEVFQGLIDLTEMLRRKFRHAAERGNAMYRVGT